MISPERLKELIASIPNLRYTAFTPEEACEVLLELSSLREIISQSEKEKGAAK